MKFRKGKKKKKGGMNLLGIENQQYGMDFMDGGKQRLDNSA